MASTSDFVFNALKEDIVFGRLHPRERLVERSLSERFGVKRGAVRSALSRLADMGLVTDSHIDERLRLARLLDPNH